MLIIFSFLVNKILKVLAKLKQTKIWETMLLMTLRVERLASQQSKKKKKKKAITC